MANMRRLEEESCRVRPRHDQTGQVRHLPSFLKRASRGSSHRFRRLRV